MASTRPVLGSLIATLKTTKRSITGVSEVVRVSTCNEPLPDAALYGEDCLEGRPKPLRRGWPSFFQFPVPTVQVRLAMPHRSERQQLTRYTRDSKYDASRCNVR